MVVASVARRDRGRGLRFGSWDRSVGITAVSLALSAVILASMVSVSLAVGVGLRDTVQRAPISVTPKIAVDGSIVYGPKLPEQGFGTSDWDAANSYLGRETLKAFREDILSLLAEEDLAKNEEVRHSLAELLVDMRRIRRASWVQPTLYTEKELRELLQKPLPKRLSPMERSVLKYVNNQILMDGPNRDLAKVLKEIQETRPQLYTKAEAQKLDGSSRTMCTLEKSVLSMTNQNLLEGLPRGDLKFNYDRVVREYDEGQSHEDAKAAFEALHGLGTDENALYALMAGKCRHQIMSLERRYFDLLLEKKAGSVNCCPEDANKRYPSQRGRRKTRCSYEYWAREHLNHTCCLLRDIKGDMSGGWLEKVSDAYHQRVIKSDDQYFWTTKVAKELNSFMKTSSAAGKEWKENGNWMQKAVGYANQAFFSAIQTVNSEVSHAQNWYLNLAAESESGFMKNVAKGGFILVSIGGSLGTRALDPTLDLPAVEEGLLDLALLFGGLGVGKIAAAVGKSALGLKAATKALQAVQKSRMLMWSVRRALGMGTLGKHMIKRVNRLEKAANAAKKAGNLVKSQHLLRVARLNRRMLKKLSQYEGALKRAKRSQAALERAVSKGKSVSEIQKLALAASKDAAAVERSLQVLQSYEKACVSMLTADKRLLLATHAATVGTHASKALAKATIDHYDKVQMARAASDLDEAQADIEASRKVSLRIVSEQLAVMRSIVRRSLGLIKSTQGLPQVLERLNEAHNSQSSSNTIFAGVPDSIVKQRGGQTMTYKDLRVLTVAVLTYAETYNVTIVSPVNNQQTNKRKPQQPSLYRVVAPDIPHIVLDSAAVEMQEHFELAMRYVLSVALRTPLIRCLKAPVMNPAQRLTPLEASRLVLAMDRFPLVMSSIKWTTVDRPGRSKMTVAQFCQAVNKLLKAAEMELLVSDLMATSALRAGDKRVSFDDAYNVFIKSFPQELSAVISYHGLIYRFPAPIFGLYVLQRTPIQTIAMLPDKYSRALAENVFELNPPAPTFRLLVSDVLRKFAPHVRSTYAGRDDPAVKKVMQAEEMLREAHLKLASGESTTQA